MICMSLEQQIKDQALALGFDAVGITDAAPLDPEHAAHFQAWLRAGCAGPLDYLCRHLDKRLHPARLLDGAKSVIVVALHYQAPAPAVGWAVPTTSIASEETADTAQPTGDKPSGSRAEDGGRRADQNRNPESEIRTLSPQRVGRVAQYAQYEDYHPFVKSLLRELADSLRAKTDATQRFKLCVDSAPVAERALAARAGLGFIGRHHLLIHPRLGPQVLLGEIITTVDLQPDAPVEGSCGDCHRCLEACPTGALRADGFLDARRCISCLTQEQWDEWNDGMLECWNTGKETSPHSTIPSFQHSNRSIDWLFGCDECLRACPFQHQAAARTNPRFRWYPERAVLHLRAVLDMTHAEFETRFHDSPIRRLGLERLQRNARLCLAGFARREDT
jgi:epoxyqueuosine reductase